MVNQKELKPASQMGGSSCGALKKPMNGGSKKSMKGGSSCGALKKPMNGGNKKVSMKGGKSKKSGKSKKPMKDNEAYCMVCKARVVVHDAKDVTKQTKTRKMVMRQALCPKGHPTYRIVGN
jgi:hypothetical protein